MAEPGESPATVRCTACGFENAPSSVYCQDCGARLVAVPSAAQAESFTSPAPATEFSAPPSPPPKSVATSLPGRARILTAKRRPRVVEVLGITLRTIIFAALVAGLIQALRPPRALPKPAKPFGPEIVANARALAQQTSQTGGPFDAPWASIDSYLAGVLPPTSSFARASIVPRAGGFLLIVERRVLGLPIYLSAEYQIVARGNGIGLDGTAAAIGRLPLPAGAAEFVPALSGGIDRALFAELDVLRTAKTVQITQEKIRFTFLAPPAP
jgi:hypothetical protein